MVPKSERMELRLDADMVEKLDEWRSEEGISRSEAVRQLVEEGLAARSRTDLRLSNPEKLMTWMLTQVLRNQINERKDKKNNQFDLKDVDLIEQAIYGGHFWALDWEMSGVLHNHIDDRKHVTAVVDILDMWSFIEEACQRFNQADRKRLVDDVGSWADNPQFLGFDGNNESEYLGIAQFLVEKLNRFQIFKGRSMNSHMPTLFSYGRMVRMFEGIRPTLIGRHLSVEEVIKLLKREVA